MGARGASIAQRGAPSVNVIRGFAEERSEPRWNRTIHPQRAATLTRGAITALKNHQRRTVRMWPKLDDGRCV
jgi:hypothetical protein